MGLRRALHGIALSFSLLATLAIAGCGDREAEQKTAFIAFLQTRIIDKPGMHVPQLTDAEKTSFGPYAEQYAIITSFHQVMNDSVSPKLTAAMTEGAITAPGDLVARRSNIEAAQTLLHQMNAALGDDLVRTDEAHRGLNQPAEVKAVFTRAYDRTVTQAAASFAAIVPVADRVFADALALGDYITAQKQSVSFSGSMLQVSDPTVLREINAKLAGLQASQKAVQEAQTTFSKFIYGK